ncbi:hypothetical protein PIB30_105012, partial [Stylosanthes scabra]|nr:hypothetical protein [Stylosanthes scabra]
KKSKRKLGKQEKRKTELQGKKKNRATMTNTECSRLGAGVAEPQVLFSLIHHPTPRHDARRLGVDEAARKMTLHQGLNA